MKELTAFTKSHVVTAEITPHDPEEFELLVKFAIFHLVEITLGNVKCLHVGQVHQVHIIISS